MWAQARRGLSEPTRADVLRGEAVCATKRSTVREHALAKVPVLLDKTEAAERRVPIRRLGSQAQTGKGLEEALALLADEVMVPDVRRARGGGDGLRAAAE